MNKTILSPLSVLSGICTIIALMAVTNVFDPLVKFVHSEAITPLEAGACLILTMAGFAASYFLLNILCGYFVPRINNTPEKTHNNRSKTTNQAHEYMCKNSER